MHPASVIAVYPTLSSHTRYGAWSNFKSRASQDLIKSFHFLGLTAEKGRKT